MRVGVVGVVRGGAWMVVVMVVMVVMVVVVMAACKGRGKGGLA